ncbi:MAG: S1/P1 nuclease [Candidatus Solibacter sp.]|nr:S1/P1 nuclease [Candidatus Solibacter sp.]
MRRLAVILVLCGSLPAFGWGPEGHNLIARLAAAHLTPAAAARVAEILGPGITLQSIASWPDQIRRDRAETGPWHYVDIPIDRPRLDMARDCPKGDCVLAKIEDFKKVLADPAATAVQRKEALMFLVHFVGDMHQPLHSADNKDKGGNDVKVDFFGRSSNLHSVWDSGLLGRLGQEDALFTQYSEDLTEKLVQKWGKGTPEAWAEQSHKVGQKVVYGKLPKATAGAQVKVDATYERVAGPVIREQIEKAGARLAAVLNATLR